MGQSSFEGPGELAAAMDDFDASLIINPLTYDESKNRRLLEESLESIISGAALLADSRYTDNFFIFYQIFAIFDDFSKSRVRSATVLSEKSKKSKKV